MAKCSYCGASYGGGYCWRSPDGNHEMDYDADDNWDDDDDCDDPTCSICGNYLDWFDCLECGGEGWIDETEIDPLDGDVICCSACNGKGGNLECLNAENHQKEVINA